MRRRGTDENLRKWSVHSAAYQYLRAAARTGAESRGSVIVLCMFCFGGTGGGEPQADRPRVSRSRVLHRTPRLRADWKAIACMHGRLRQSARLSSRLDWRHAVRKKLVSTSNGHALVRVAVIDAQHQDHASGSGCCGPSRAPRGCPPCTATAAASRPQCLRLLHRKHRPTSDRAGIPCCNS
jgi:hypothetical protein